MQLFMVWYHCDVHLLYGSPSSCAGMGWLIGWLDTPPHVNASCLVLDELNASSIDRVSRRVWHAAFSSIGMRAALLKTQQHA